MIGSLMMCLSVVVLLVGNAGRHRHGHCAKLSLAPAHAHLNLIGGVLLFLFGLYYRPVPAAGTDDPRQGAGLAAHGRRDPVSGRRRRRAAEGTVGRSRPDRGLAARGRGDGAVRCDRVPDRAGLTRTPSRRRPSAVPVPAVTF